MKDFTSKHPRIFGLLFLAALAGALYGGKFIYVKMTRGRRDDDVNPSNNSTVKGIDADGDVRIDITRSDDHSDDHSDDGSYGRSENPTYNNSNITIYNGCTFNDSSHHPLIDERKPTALVKNKDNLLANLENEFKRKLSELINYPDGDHRFKIKRPQDSTLVITFVAEGTIMEDKEIKVALIQLAKLLRPVMASNGLAYQARFYWESRTLELTVKESVTLDSIAELLQRMSSSHFSSLSEAQAALFYKSKTGNALLRPTEQEKEPIVDCRMQ